MLRADALRGRFIVLDGPDGSGKTTLLPQLADRLRSAGLDVTACKDPGGTVIGDRIRGVLLDHDLSGMDATCEALLFMASRAQLVAEVVRPALARGGVVLCDRFVSSTCAYQVAAGCRFNAVIDLARHAIGTTWPDLTLILDVPAAVGLERVRRRRGATGSCSGFDSIESRSTEYHESVRGEFRRLPNHYPGTVEIVDACAPIESVVADALRRIGRFAAQGSQGESPAARRASA